MVHTLNAGRKNVEEGMHVDTVIW